MKIRLIDDAEAPVALPIGESTLYVRRIPTSVRRSTERTHRRAIPKNHNGQGDPDALPTYLQGVEDDLLDYALVRWEGLDGDPPCDKAAKVRLPDDVREAVFRVAKSIARAASEAEETDAKNSASPSATLAS